MHASSPPQHRGSQDSPVHSQGQSTDSETAPKPDPLEEAGSWRLPAAITTAADATDVQDREMPFTD
jgi:hypothetical protein